MNKKKAAFFMSALLALSLTACLYKDSSPYGQERVLEYVDSICAEPYELTGKEKISEDPDNIQYHFRTTGRNLSFTANSYLSPIYLDATRTQFYTRSLSCNYVNTVRELYRSEIEDILNQGPHYMEDSGWYYLLSFTDAEAAADMILAADAVYSRELAWNSPQFLQENPAASIHFIWCGSQEEALAREHWVNVTDIGITGQHDRQEILDRLGDICAQLYVDGEIAASDIPESYLEDKHVSVLSSIELNGRPLLYDSQDNPYGPFLLSTDDYCFSWYSRDLESYLLTIDTGLVSDSMSFPLIIREYVRALGGVYDVRAEEDVYVSTWTIDGNTWTMQAEYGDEGLLRLNVNKNGKSLDLPYVTVSEDFHVSATFCVGVTAKDFCRLFDLTFQVSEETGTLSFES